MRKVNQEVLVADAPIVTLTRDNIAELKRHASENPRQRIRICAHRNMDDTIHEMLIVLTKGCYIRPHKHIGKGESFHIIEGALDVVEFDEEGNVTNVFSLGDYASGKNFYYRNVGSEYHTVVIRSKIVVFHETTQGPFRPSDNVPAPWSPDDKDAKGIAAFLARIDRGV